jgi:hypothetical protein
VNVHANILFLIHDGAPFGQCDLQQSQATAKWAPFILRVIAISKERMMEVALRGRVASKSPEARARVAATQRRHAAAWGKWLPSSQPDWLTEETYTTKIKPLLERSSNTEIAMSLHVSIPYAASIRLGRRQPHPRHWKALASVVGLSPDRQ